MSCQCELSCLCGWPYFQQNSHFLETGSQNIRLTRESHREKAFWILRVKKYLVLLNKKQEKDMFAIKMTTWSSHLFRRWFRQGLSGARGLRPKTWPRLSVTDSFQAREWMFRGCPPYPSQDLPQVYYCCRGHSGPTLSDAVHVPMWGEKQTMLDNTPPVFRQPPTMGSVSVPF